MFPEPRVLGLYRQRVMLQVQATQYVASAGRKDKSRQRKERSRGGMQCNLTSPSMEAEQAPPRNSSSIWRITPCLLCSVFCPPWYTLTKSTRISATAVACPEAACL
eukprot:1157895-Pelagomonas_calceolata.AAC.7